MAPCNPRSKSSPNPRRTDEGEKLEGYCALPSLENYLLVESERALVISYRRKRDGFVREVHSGLSAIKGHRDRDAAWLEVTKQLDRIIGRLKKQRGT